MRSRSGPWASRGAPGRTHLVHFRYWPSRHGPHDPQRLKTSHATRSPTRTPQRSDARGPIASITPTTSCPAVGINHPSSDLSNLCAPDRTGCCSCCAAKPAMTRCDARGEGRGASGLLLHDHTHRRTLDERVRARDDTKVLLVIGPAHSAGFHTENPIIVYKHIVSGMQRLCSNALTGQESRRARGREEAASSRQQQHFESIRDDGRDSAAPPPSEALKECAGPQCAPLSSGSGKDRSANSCGPTNTNARAIQQRCQAVTLTCGYTDACAGPPRSPKTPSGNGRF